MHADPQRDGGFFGDDFAFDELPAHNGKRDFSAARAGAILFAPRWFDRTRREWTRA